ncbi:hypothetical protein Vretifemale_406, partial [Volvox reticuliferus]
ARPDDDDLALRRPSACCCCGGCGCCGCAAATSLAPSVAKRGGHGRLPLLIARDDAAEGTGSRSSIAACAPAPSPPSAVVGLTSPSEALAACSKCGRLESGSEALTMPSDRDSKRSCNSSESPGIIADAATVGAAPSACPFLACSPSAPASLTRAEKGN